MATKTQEQLVRDAAKALKALLGDTMTAQWAMTGAMSFANRARGECVDAGNGDGADIWGIASSRLRDVHKAIPAIKIAA